MRPEREFEEAPERRFPWWRVRMFVSRLFVVGAVATVLAGSIAELVRGGH